MAKKITLKQARLAKRLTQQGLEAETERRGNKIDQRSISKMERRGSEPLFTNGLTLADALGVDPHALTFGASR